MSTGVLHRLFPYHCGSYGTGCHVLSGNGVLGFAHLDHSLQMRPAPLTPNAVDLFLSRKPAVHKQVVELHMLDGGIVEHPLHAGHLALTLPCVSRTYIRSRALC